MFASDSTSVGNSKRPLRILSADDEIYVGEFLNLVFSGAGHIIEHFPNGLAAWERISGAIDSFDVLITDNRMPELNGLELVELLRQAKFKGGIVVLSGSISWKDVESYRLLGVDTILGKTIKPDELLNAVETSAYKFIPGGL